MSLPGATTDPKRRTRTLAIVLGVLMLVLAWTNLRPILFPPDSPSVSASDRGDRPAARSRRSRGGTASAIPKEIKDLHLAALDPRAQSYEIGRNLWAYYVPPPPPPPPRLPPPPPPVVVPQPVLPPPPVVPQPPRITFSYLGSLGPKRKKVAVFAAGDQIINALEGDVVQNSFRVARIGFESVTIEYVDFPDAQPAQLKVGG